MALLERFARGVPTGWGMGARLRVRPKLAIAIARETVVLSDHPREVNALSARPLTGPSLCLEIVNDGRRPLVCAEVGLAGRFDAPHITMHEPMLHDSKGWPRRLDPGESVITYFGPGLANHPGSRRHAARLGAYDERRNLARHRPRLALFRQGCRRAALGSAGLSPALRPLLA